MKQADYAVVFPVYVQYTINRDKMRIAFQMARCRGRMTARHAQPCAATAPGQYANRDAGLIVKRALSMGTISPSMFRRMP